MKALAYAISMTVGAASALTALVPPAAAGAASPCASASGDAAGYPTFCAIPQPPHDVRTAAQFKSAVVATRIAGRSMVRAAQAGGWSLAEGDATAFGAQAAADAAPPPPTTSADDDTADFARAAREAAAPPARPH